MPPTDDHDAKMRSMLLDLEQAIKTFLEVAEKEGMNKREIEDFLKRECNQTVDEVLRSRIIH